MRALADFDGRAVWLYVLVLAAISPLAGFLAYGVIGQYQTLTVFNMRVPPTWVRAPAVAGVVALVRFGLAFAGWQMSALVLSATARLFGGRADLVAARRVTALAATPLFVAGIFELAVSIPHLDWIRWLAWSVAIVWATCIATWAAPSFVGTPDDKALGHALVAIATTLIAVVVAFYVTGFVVVALVVSG